MANLSSLVAFPDCAHFKLVRHELTGLKVEAKLNQAKLYLRVISISLDIGKKLRSKTQREPEIYSAGENQSWPDNKVLS